MSTAKTHFGASLRRVYHPAASPSQSSSRSTTNITTICRKWSKAHARKRLPIDASAKCSGTRSGVSMIKLSSVVAADISQEILRTEFESDVRSGEKFIYELTRNDTKGT